MEDEIMQVIRKIGSSVGSDFGLSNDLDELVIKRCENALITNISFMKLQEEIAKACKKRDFEKYSELNSKMQIESSILCYRLAIKDISYILKGIM